MNNLELIDRLCAVVEMQSAIIRQQAFFIEEQLAVDTAIKGEFAEQRNKIDGEIASLGIKAESGFDISRKQGG